MSHRETESGRVLFMQVLVMLAFSILALQLWRLQILKAEEYQGLADVNRFRLVSVDAPRGVIYDREGRLLVRNVPNYVVSIVPGVLPEDDVLREAILNRLSQLLGIPVRNEPASTGEADGTSIEAILETNTLSPYSAVPIKSGVEKQIALLIEEEHLYLPGVLVEVRPLREYPTGAVTSHVLGFAGPIPSEEVSLYLGRDNEDYAINDPVGLASVENAYESELRGRKGLKHIEVDAFEREVRVLATDAAQPGDSLFLTLDLELQQAAESALREGMYRVNSTAGVVVAMNPQTGEVLALVSLPSYDNNLFARGISIEDYQTLSEDPERPLVNHALSGQYPPGSTFKIVAAAAGLQEKLITPKTHLTCRGEMILPNKYFPNDPLKAQVFRCWTAWGHGAVNVLDALAQSCDIYFYQVGGGFEDFAGLGMDRLKDYCLEFGFGELSGIALPGEAAGLVPDDRWKRMNYGESWVTGDTYNAVIGQGFVLATPLQLLNAAAAIANGGTLYRPQILYRAVDAQGYLTREFSPETIRRLSVSAENLQLVQQGMREAVTDGTAERANLGEVAVAGKTGTAEYAGPRDEEGNLPSHAWFITYAPYEEPEIALVVFVSGGYNGAKVAVPIAARILRSYFGLPQPADEDIVAPPPGD